MEGLASSFEYCIFEIARCGLRLSQVIACLMFGLLLLRNRQFFVMCLECVY